MRQHALGTRKGRFVMTVNRRRSVVVLVAACVLAAWSAANALAASGGLDPSFGGNGKVNTNLTLGADYASAVAIQEDGKIVAAGLEGTGRFGLVRYLADGRLDPTFSGDGRVTTDFTARTDFARAVAIQDNGKIVAAGFAGDKATFALARYTPNGRIDPTFSGDGRVTTNITFGEDVAYGVAVQADGKIVAAGSAREGGDAMFAVARYRTNGTLDPAFGDNGRLVTNFSPGGDMAFAVAIQRDGKIVAAGAARRGTSSRVAVARYLPGTGRPDPTFSGDGRATTNLTSGDDYANAVALQDDGRIVVAGTGGFTAFALLRYGPQGGLDPGFGDNGRVMTQFTAKDDLAHGVAIQADGKIVAAGSAREGQGDSTFALARYRHDGRLDRTFGGDGRVMTNFSPWGDYANAVAIQDDGRIVAAGQAAGAGGRFALARYRP